MTELGDYWLVVLVLKKKVGSTAQGLSVNFGGVESGGDRCE